MKKYLFGIFAVALAIGFSAFTPNHKISTGNNGKFVNVWYRYIGAQTAVERAKATNYVKYTGSDIQADCPDADLLCAAKFPDNGSQPTQAAVNAKAAAIESAVSTNVETSEIELFAN